MAHIKLMEIYQFRGIQQLIVSDFSRINLIVGDNNCGKTTFLEAIQLLFTKAQISSVKNIIKQRTVLNLNDNSFYVSFINMFNVNNRDSLFEFDLYAESDKGPIQFEIRGHEKTLAGEDALQMSQMSARQKLTYKQSSFLPEMVKVFEGSIIGQSGKKTIEKEIRLTSLDSSVSGAVSKKEVQYIPSFGHLRYDLLKNIVDNPEYKRLAISILKQFDESIVDICYTKADDGVSFLETVITADGVNRPLSVYGDGIKKILYILNKLFDATDSILLIDEIETGLHKKYYDKLFPVVFELAKKLNVQLFIATHSMEAIDAILAYGKYDEENDNDPIKVITLKKVSSKERKGSNVVARNVTGRYVYDNRKAFEFEVRL